MGNSNKDRLWVAGGVVGGILMTVLAWFMLISPQLSDASSLKDQKSSAESQNLTIQTRITRLQSANLDDLRSQLATARQALPFSNGLAEFTRQLASEANASLVTVTSITAAAPVVVTGGAAAATAGAPGSATTSAAGQTFAIPVTIVATGTPERLQSLLQKIQTLGPRRALVASTAMTPSGGNGTGNGISGGASLNAQMQIFVAPQTPEAEAELEKLAAGK